MSGAVGGFHGAKATGRVIEGDIGFVSDDLPREWRGADANPAHEHSDIEIAYRHLPAATVEERGDVRITGCQSLAGRQASWQPEIVPSRERRPLPLIVSYPLLMRRSALGSRHPR